MSQPDSGKFDPEDRISLTPLGEATLIVLKAQQAS